LEGDSLAARVKQENGGAFQVIAFGEIEFGDQGDVGADGDFEQAN